MQSLVVEPLTAEAFVPFGDVIEAGTRSQVLAINAGTSQRFHDLAKLDAGIGGRLIISIFRAQPRLLPLAITMLERHPLASQAFVPLSPRPFLVVVALAGDEAIATGQIRAFLAHNQQGVNFAPGVWHHPLIALDAESDFLVIDRDAPNGNCDERELPATLTLDLPPGAR